MMPSKAAELAYFWAPGVRAARVALLAGLAAFALFAGTASPYVGTHDVAEFQALAGTGGIAHAGYPTLILLERAAAQLPFGTLAWRANVLSAGCGALAVAALAYVAMRLTRRAFVSVLAALAFAMSYTMWSESAQIGVHALTLALGSTAFLLLLRMLHRPSAAGALALGVLLGLGLTCHLTSVALALPLALAMFWLVRARALRAAHVALLAMGLCLGLAPFAATLASDTPTQRLNYMNDTFDPADGPQTVWAPDLTHRLARLRWLLSGRQYLREQKYSLATLPARALSLGLDEAVNEFPLPSLLIAAAGLLALLARGGALGALLGAWALGIALLTARGGTELTAPWFFLPGAWLLGLGLAAACAAISARSSALGIALAVALAVLPLVRVACPKPPGPLSHSSRIAALWARWPAQWSPFRHDPRDEAFARAVLAALPPGAIVLGRWDPTAVLRYVAWGERLRPDVDVRFAPDQDGARFAQRWQAAAATGRPVYITDLPDAATLAGGTAQPILRSRAYGLWRLWR